MKFPLLYFLQPASQPASAVSLCALGVGIAADVRSPPSLATALPAKAEIDVPPNTHPLGRLLTCSVAYVKFSYLFSPPFPHSFIRSDSRSGPVLITREPLVSPQSGGEDFARQKRLAVGSA